MRYFGHFLILLILFVSICGCTQTISAPATPVPTPLHPVITITETPIPTLSPGQTQTNISALKQIDISAWENPNNVTVQYNGGPNSADLVNLKIQIIHSNGFVSNRNTGYPVIGAQYIFMYQGVVNAQIVKVTGVFRDGTEQPIFVVYL